MEIIVYKQVCKKDQFQEIEIVNVLVFIFLTNIQGFSIVNAASCIGQLANETALWRATNKWESANLLLVKFDFH